MYLSKHYYIYVYLDYRELIQHVFKTPNVCLRCQACVMG